MMEPTVDRVLQRVAVAMPEHEDRCRRRGGDRGEARRPITGPPRSAHAAADFVPLIPEIFLAAVGFALMLAGISLGREAPGR